MLAAIPFFELRVTNIDIGIATLPIDPWATLVAIGIVVGLEVARWKGIREGLDTRDIVDGAVAIVASGFVGAHLVTLFFYYPERLVDNGITALVAPQGFSSTGGFFGAVVGAWAFYRYLRPHVSALQHADVIAFGFPFGWFFGRLGCASVHDHIGSKTNFFLAMDFGPGFDPTLGAAYADGIRHELGMYEAMLMVVVMALFLYWGRQHRPAGFYLASFGLLYAPVRFGLDFLRNTDLTHQDARYLGLTPAQYGMVLLFGASVWLFLRVQKAEPA